MKLIQSKKFKTSRFRNLFYKLGISTFLIPTLKISLSHELKSVSEQLFPTHPSILLLIAMSPGNHSELWLDEAVQATFYAAN